MIEEFIFKSLRIIDGRPKWVLINENGDIVNRNPTKEQIENAKFEYSNFYRIHRFKGRKCRKCGNDISDPSRDNHGTRYLDDKGNWDGKSWLCNCCYMKDYNKDRNDNADWRTGNLSRYSPSGKGFIGAQIVARTLGVDDCNIIMDNFNFYIDLGKHSKYGYIEVKTATLDIECGEWSFILNLWKQILVCMDQYEPWKNVKKLYAISYGYVINNKGITITDITSKYSKLKWERFKIDEKPFDDTYHKMDIKRCKVLRKDE